MFRFFRPFRDSENLGVVFPALKRWAIFEAALWA
jgi:hypothetical protein